MDNHNKRVHCIERLTNILRAIINKDEIYFQPLLSETMRVFSVCEATAREYIAVALARVGLTKEEIQWYDKEFVKTSCNENQKVLV